jgi:hypothetical protein
MPEITAQQAAVARVSDLWASNAHYSESSDHQFMIRDLLTDVRHFCEFYGVDVYAAMHASHAVYTEERQSGA